MRLVGPVASKRPLWLPTYTDAQAGFGANSSPWSIPGALENGSAITSRIDLEHAAERHEDRSHAGAWERGKGGGRKKAKRDPLQLRAKAGLNANGCKGNTEDDGAHACVGGKSAPGAPALRGLDLRRIEVPFFERLREATSYEVVT